MRTATIVHRVVAVSLCVTTLAAQAEECFSPRSPEDPPSGAAATREQMLSAQEAMKTFKAAVEAFAACIEKSDGDPLKANDAERRLEAAAARFNAELRAFRQKNGG
jgi:hypothetical protein